MRFGKRRREARMDAELRYDLDSLARDFMAEGMSPAEARRRARLEFGGLEQIKEECRDATGRWLQDFARDFRYSVRTLRRSPGFLAVSVLSLALGIGANAAIFSLIDAVMLRPLAVKEPGRGDAADERPGIRRAGHRHIAESRDHQPEFRPSFF